MPGTYKITKENIKILPYSSPDKIADAEQRFNNLLPVERLKDRPSQELLITARTWSELIWAQAEQMDPIPLSNEQLIQGLQLAQNAVFICGVHRSGTTLLRDILDGHPELVVLPSEGTYYTNQEAKLQSMAANEWAGYLGREWLRRLANPINQPPYWLLGRTTNTASPYLDFARYVKTWWTIVNQQPGTQWPHMAIVLAYASCMGRLDAKLWVDKTPNNERFLKRIWKEMPGAKIIHMIREPVATLASHKKMDPSGKFRLSLCYLKNSFIIAAQQSARDDSKFLLLRYEDLCNEPQKIIAELADFLSIKPSHILHQPSVAGIPSQANSSFNQNAEAGKIFKPRGKEDGKFLSRSEQKLIAAYLGEITAQYNYPLGKISSLSKLYLMLKYRLFM